MRNMGLIKRKKCRNCGEPFFAGSLVSDYCVSCLKKYHPELKPFATSCVFPLCKHYQEKMGFFGTKKKCVKHNKKIKTWSIVGVKNCPDHEPRKQPYKLTAKRVFGIIETEGS